MLMVHVMLWIRGLLLYVVICVHLFNRLPIFPLGDTLGIDVQFDISIHRQLSGILDTELLAFLI